MAIRTYLAASNCQIEATRRSQRPLVNIPIGIGKVAIGAILLTIYTVAMLIASIVVCCHRRNGLKMFSEANELNKAWAAALGEIVVGAIEAIPLIGNFFAWGLIKADEREVARLGPRDVPSAPTASVHRTPTPRAIIQPSDRERRLISANLLGVLVLGNLNLEKSVYKVNSVDWQYVIWLKKNADNTLFKATVTFKHLPSLNSSVPGLTIGEIEIVQHRSAASSLVDRSQSYELILKEVLCGISSNYTLASDPERT